MDIDEWLAVGYAAGYCGPVLCYTHDGPPLTEDEENEFNDGGDPCLAVLRVYPDIETKTAVEKNHSPSEWRK